MANPFNDAAAERSNKRVLAKAREQRDDPSRATQEAERRARLDERRREEDARDLARIERKHGRASR